MPLSVVKSLLTQRNYKRNRWYGLYSAWQARTQIFFFPSRLWKGGMKEADLWCPLCTFLLNMWPSVFEISFIRSSFLLEYVILEKQGFQKRQTLYVSVDAYRGKTSEGLFKVLSMFCWFGYFTSIFCSSPFLHVRICECLRRNLIQMLLNPLQL